MNPILISSGVFALIFAGVPFGMFLRRRLPEEHFCMDAQETVRLAIELVVTMTGLVLGMLVSSSKSSHDAQKDKIAEMSAQIIILNSLLIFYGPETKSTRIEVRREVEETVDNIWPSEASLSSRLRPTTNDQSFAREMQLLTPKDELHISIKAEVQSMASNLIKTRWLMFLDSEQTSMSIPLLVVVTSWLVAIFISFGVFAPANSTVMVTLMVCALAASTAIFIILKMYSPFSGILRISPTAVRDALSQLAAN
jgi:hypothetical protein